MSYFSELVMECHLKSKRHCRFAEEQRKRKEDSDCSIFVRGFPPGTTDHHLKLFFNRFGMVTNVFLEKERVGISLSSDIMTST